MIKKISYILLIVVVIVITTIFAFVKYSKHNAAKSLIANNASWVVQIDGIEYLKENWQSLIKSNRSKLSDTSVFSLIDVPTYFYLFGVKDQPNIVFSYLPVKKDVVINKLLEGNNWLQVDENCWQKDNLIIQRNGNKVLFGIKFYVEINFEQLDLNSFVAIESTSYKSLLDLDCLIAGATDEKDIIQMDFENGAININGSIQGLPNQKLLGISRMPNTFLFVNFPIAINKIPYLNSAFSKEEDGQKMYDLIEPNSYTVFSIIDSSFTIQDTIIKYDYDDNFNKVETKITQAVDIPFCFLAFSKQANAVIDSFIHGTHLKKALLPLYPFSVYNANNNIVLLSTANNPNTTIGATSDSGNIYVAFDTFIKHFPTLNRFEFLKELEILNIDCNYNNNVYQFKGKLTLKDKNKASVSLLKFFIQQ